MANYTVHFIEVEGDIISVNHIVYVNLIAEDKVDLYLNTPNERLQRICVSGDAGRALHSWVRARTQTVWHND